MNNLTWSDPATAAAWSAAISDDKQRSSSMENVARNWLNQDETAARQWISESSLSDEVKKRLLERYKR